MLHFELWIKTCWKDSQSFLQNRCITSSIMTCYFVLRYINLWGFKLEASYMVWKYINLLHSYRICMSHFEVYQKQFYFLVYVLCFLVLVLVVLYGTYACHHHIRIPNWSYTTWPYINVIINHTFYAKLCEMWCFLSQLKGLSYILS